MFTCSSVTLWKTVEKTKIRLNFYFRVVKWGVSSRGIPLLTPSGSRGAPCFWPLIFQLENRNSPLISFSQLFSRTVTDKQVNKGPLRFLNKQITKFNQAQEVKISNPTPKPTAAGARDCILQSQVISWWIWGPFGSKFDNGNLYVAVD